MDSSIEKGMAKFTEISVFDKLSASGPVDGYLFRSIDRTMSDLLTAACGLQHFEHGDEELGFLVASVGKHIQRLRNDMVEQLNPIFSAFGIEQIR